MKKKYLYLFLRVLVYLLVLGAVWRWKYACFELNGAGKVERIYRRQKALVTGRSSFMSRCCFYIEDRYVW